MSLKAGWKELHRGEKVPEREYHWKIVGYTAPNDKGSEFVRVQIQKKAPKNGAAPDEEVVGKTTGVYLGNEQTGVNFGFANLMKSMKLDGDESIEGPDLVGLFFDGDAFYREDNNGVERLNVKPTIDYKWVDTEFDGQDPTKRSTKTSRRKTSSASADERRSKRRSR
jgi:hypothetical protein